MSNRFSVVVLLSGIMIATLTGCATTSHVSDRCAVWVDVYTGEPTTFEQMMDDLAESDVIYLGERHTLDRHHDIQHRVVDALIARDKAVVLGMEMLEVDTQPVVDRYTDGELTFEQLADEIDWKKRWSNYEDYRSIVEAAHDAGAPVIALNARLEIVRSVARQGMDDLSVEQRMELPASINLDDPAYEDHMKRVMMVHAMMPESMMRQMFEAQVTRDETMADAICRFLQSPAGEGRIAVVLCGSGHVSYGMGIPSRVQRRMPDVRDRIIVMSESGDVELSEMEKKMARQVTITHEDLREIDSPIADYLHVVDVP